MNKRLIKTFGITSKGVKSLYIAVITSILTFIVYMLPIIAIMLLIKSVIDKSHTDVKVIVAYSIICFILMLIVLWINYNSLYTGTYKESSNMRFELIEKIGALPMSFFSKHDLTDLSQTLMADVNSIEHGLSHSIPESIGLFFYLIFIMIVIEISSPLLGLAIVIPSLLSIIFIFSNIKLDRATFHKYYLQERDNSKEIQNLIELKTEIDSLSLNNEIEERLLKQMDQSQKIRTRGEFTVAIILNVAIIIAYLQIALVSIWGVWLYSQGRIELIYLIGYIFASVGISTAIVGFHEKVAEVTFIDSKAKKINMIREEKVMKGNDMSFNTYDIEAKNICFSYNRDRVIIDDLSCLFENNRVSAIVGASGCGKTTLLRLLARLYDVDSGSITIDNKGISNCSTESLYKNISIVFQEVLLFNNTIMENIRVGNTEATDEMVIEAAKLANCHEFIEKLEKGYDTVIGENGCSLSGGERQRLSIARAILKDAPIILLDELTSSLDVENERKIQRALTSLIKNKTVILITHRLKLAQNVDKIIVMENGKIESMGNHEELLSTSRVYKNLLEKSEKISEFKYMES